MVAEKVVALLARLILPRLGENLDLDSRHGVLRRIVTFLFCVKNNNFFCQLVMIRSLKKGPFVVFDLLRKAKIMSKKSEEKIIKTWSRTSIIVPNIIGCIVSVHNGREYFMVIITNRMVGHKLGEFALTRTFHQQTKSKKKKLDAHI